MTGSIRGRHIETSKLRDQMTGLGCGAMASLLAFSILTSLTIKLCDASERARGQAV